MGKTNFGSVFAEELARAKAKWSVIDPMGVWWGLRHAADGIGKGVECLILGGAHGDIPIEPTGGAIIADLVVDNDVNVIIDISRITNGEMWSIGERIRFVADYGRQLYKRQGSLVDSRRREPICQIIDEAARFIPQVIRAGDFDAAKCESIWSTIVEEGRNVGIGVMLLTQRSARLNKNVAELADMMLAFRTIGPNSLQAVMDWLGAHIEKKRLQDFSAQVRSLPRGSALLVSPGWLGIEKVVRIRLRTTFDSSATPKAGERQIKVKGEGAMPDLKLYAERMKETIERAKADDPKALRQKIQDLETKLAAKGSTDMGFLEEAQRAQEELTGLRAEIMQVRSDAERAVYREGVVRDALAVLSRAASELVNAFTESEQRIKDLESVDSRPYTPSPPSATPIPSPRALPAPSQPVSRPSPALKTADPQEPSGLPPVCRRILEVFARLRGMGIAQPSLRFVCVLSGYSNTRSTGFEKAMGRLRTSGLVTSGTGNVWLTEDGVAAAPRINSPITNEELHARIMEAITPVGGRLLTLLLKTYPDGISKEDLCRATGYSNVRSTGFEKALGELSSKGFIRRDVTGVFTTALCFVR